MNQNIWYTKSTNESLELLGSRDHGLTRDEVVKKREKFGSNRLPNGKVDNIFIIFLRQFQSPLIYILFIASGIIFYFGGIADALIILTVLFFNAVVGTYQEGKAQNTLLALKNFVETQATVVREGKELIIPDTELVLGDIILLGEGEKVPADARILFANNLKTDEASLTGESGAVHKTAEALETSLGISDQTNMLFKGTGVLGGTAKAVVVAIGIETAIGKISKQILTIDTELPLKANIRSLSRLIIYVVVGITSFLFLLGISQGEPSKEMFTTVVSLAVSIIPEGLPIVMTLVLASGVWRMSKRHVLVKTLQAVETLGQARIIAVDKTGTITKNEMVVQKVYVDNKIFMVGGVGYESTGEISLMGKTVDPVNHPELLLSGKIATFCASARLSFLEEQNIWRVTGDPTEASMLVFGEKIGFHKDELERESPLIGEIPFDYTLKYHTAVHGYEGKKIMTVVGAPEVVLTLSDKIWHSDGVRLLGEGERKSIGKIYEDMSKEGLRVVAYAFSDTVPEILIGKSIVSLTFVGFFGIKDALRSEAVEAVKQAKLAGVKVVMITGDHKLTAVSIAEEIGIYKRGDTVLEGGEIEHLSDEELKIKVANTSVFVRVTPEHKLRIINAYKSRGEIIAMTGDGVNDAPSLVAADLGVSMGKIGTEVAKEASDLVLLDDNFGNIIYAVEEGRSIYKTIRKVILYLFSTNIGEALTIVVALLLGFPLPILAAQIIWLNFVTDGFLDVALAMEPKEEGLLRGNFEKPKKYLVDSLMGKRILLMSITMMIGTLYLFNQYYKDNLPLALTVSLTTLAVFQWFNAWNCRHESESLFQMNPFENKYLIFSTVLIISLHLLVIYLPFLQKIIHTVSLTLSEWLTIIPVAFSVVVVEEIRKFFYRRKLSKG